MSEALFLAAPALVSIRISLIYHHFGSKMPKNMNKYPPVKRGVFHCIKKTNFYLLDKSSFFIAKEQYNGAQM